ncbi:MAG: TolC family outer membrane protein [Alphaproteobacteria bacterium]|nr:TolC family outer membrane protein [Alphaproteobacteria bacterium]
MRAFKLPLLISVSLSSLILGAPADAETLAEAVSAAFATNPQLEIERYRTDIARENLDLARSAALPRVNLSGSGGYEPVDTNSALNFGVGDRPIASAQLQAVQPIYTGGRISAGIRQAKAGIDSADRTFDAARQDLILNVITAYVDVRRDRDTVAIRQNNVEVTGEQVRAAEDRFEVGVVTRTDVAQAQARLEGARAALAGAEAALQGSEAVYEFLTGQRPGELEIPPALPALPADVESAFADANENNPSIRAAREDLRAAGAGVDAAKAEGRPQISVVGTASIQETWGDTSREDTSVSAVAQGTIPLFTGGSVRARVNSAKLEREQARRRVDAFETQVRAQVAQAWYGYDAATRAIEASRRQVEAAEIAYEGAKEELAVGVRTTLDVLDQEQQLFEARLALVGAERDAYVAAHQLLRATGGLDTIG